MAHDPADHDHESEHERLNREFDQLLEGLRVALPGVQVLLAFLLTAPFSQQFDTIDGDSRALYLLAVTAAAVASVLLISTSIHHRVRFRDGTKVDMIRTGNVLVIAAALCLGVSMGSALYVVGDSFFPATAARWLGPGLTVLAAIVWFGWPLTWRNRRPT